MLPVEEMAEILVRVIDSTRENVRGFLENMAHSRTVSRKIITLRDINRGLLSIPSTPSPFDDHDFKVHGIMHRNLIHFNRELVEEAARESKRILDRHGSPFAEVAWNVQEKRYEWPQFEIIQSKGGFGLRMKSIANVTIPYLGVYEQERREEDRYVMEIPDDYRHTEDYPRYINADPFLHSAMMTRHPEGEEEAGVRVGLFGLGIAGFINEPGEREQINLVPCSDSFKAENGDDIPFFMCIVSPIGIPFFVPVHVQFMTAITGVAVTPADRECLVVYSIQDLKDNVSSEWPSGINEETFQIVRQHPMPRHTHSLPRTRPRRK